MSDRARTILFFVRSLAWFLVLQLGWFFFGSAFGRAFANTADYSTYGHWGDRGILGSPATARVYHRPENDSARDIQIVIGNYATKRGTDHIRTSSRHLAFIPAATILALALATPVPWFRRFKIAVIGGICVAVFVACRGALILIFAFTGPQPYCIFELRSPWDRMAFILYDLVAVEPAISYVVSLVIWGLVSLGFGGFDRIFRPSR